MAVGHAEYVELERFQEAITNHTEDKLAMVDHSGDSNNMVEPVTTACKLRDAVDTIRNSGIAIDGEKSLQSVMLSTLQTTGAEPADQ